MGVVRKVSNDYTTIRISKKAYNVIQCYQELIGMKTSTKQKPEKIELTIDRIFLDPKVGYPAFKKPLRKTPIPTINRFKPKETE